jgi:hypothetical protein
MIIQALSIYLINYCKIIRIFIYIHLLYLRFWCHASLHMNIILYPFSHMSNVVVLSYFVSLLCQLEVRSAVINAHPLVFLGCEKS